MDDKIKILFQQIKLDESHQQRFNDLKLKSVKVSEKENSWTFLIESPTILESEDYILLDTLSKEAFQNIHNIVLKICPVNIDNTKIKDYYQYTLDNCKTILTIANIFNESLLEKDGDYIIVVENKAEEQQALEIIDKINYQYHLYGFDKNITILLDESKREETKEWIALQM